MSAPDRIWACHAAHGGRLLGMHDGEVSGWDEYARADLLTAAQAEIARLTAERDAFRRNLRDTFDAMCAMRNSINEYLPMPSLESDLLKGPENSVFCAAVAEAVVSALTVARAERDAAMAGRVKVKPLVWQTSGRKSDRAACYAYGLHGYGYEIFHDGAWFSLRGPDGRVGGALPSIEAAKAAAQADYEARILAALQPDTERAEPVADVVRGVWGRCEAMEDEAYAKLESDKLTDHERGFWRGQKLAAKSIRRSTELPQPAPAPQAREITVQEAAGALLDKDGRADAKLVDIADEIYAAGGSMSRAIGVALRAIAAMQKGR